MLDNLAKAPTKTPQILRSSDFGFLKILTVLLQIPTATANGIEGFKYQAASDG